MRLNEHGNGLDADQLVPLYSLSARSPCFPWLDSRPASSTFSNVKPCLRSRPRTGRTRNNVNRTKTCFAKQPSRLGQKRKNNERSRAKRFAVRQRLYIKTAFCSLMMHGDAAMQASPRKNSQSVRKKSAVGNGLI